MNAEAISHFFNIDNCFDMFSCVILRLEEKQRAEKKTREMKGDPFKPKWFNLTDEVASTPWGDLEVYEYNGKHAEHRAAIDLSDNNAETENESIEFNPWQYGKLQTA